MMHKKDENRSIYYLFVLMLLCKSIVPFAQDSVHIVDSPVVNINDKLRVFGYVKHLSGVSLDRSFRYISSMNLFHHRLNFKWTPSQNLSGVLELRNRLIWGDEISQTPNYASMLRNKNEWVNLQTSWVQQSGLILHTNVERLWLQWQHNRLTIRAGRQRINWGVTTNWNPNDLFDTFNFLDFDYEEGPASDAISFHYSIETDHSLELVASKSGDHENNVVGLRYFFHHKTYDYYTLLAWYNQQLTLGAAWAGNMGEAGLKGEIQWFPAMNGLSAQFNISSEWDFVFKNGWYIKAGMLYTSSGSIERVGSLSLVNFSFSPKTLMPSRWNVSFTSIKELTPLLNLNCVIVYAPRAELFLFLPSLQFSLMQNLDLDLVWQSFFASENDRFSSQGLRSYLRMKWTF